MPRISWFHKFMCWLSRHPTRTVMAFPETGVALRITGCLCGKVHETTGQQARFPMPAQRVRRIA
jgi:hypothetical protein